METLKDAKWKIIALLLVAGLGLMAAFLEGYLDLILGSVKFMLFFAAVLAGCIITALYMEGKTKFFIWLLVFGFFIGLVTQMVGTTNDLWAYKESFVFGGFSWALAAITMLGLSLFLSKQVLKDMDGKIRNVVALFILFLALPTLLGKMITEVRMNFWIYYFVLFVFAVVVTYHLKLSTLLSLILAAWLMGLMSEYMGSSIGLWKFYPEMTESVACWSPPPYLTFGCWPLEFITQIALTSYISRITMKDVYEKRRPAL